jgi:hydrogenase-4 component A
VAPPPPKAALGTLAGDDEDDRPPPPKPIRMTNQFKAVSLTPPAAPPAPAPARPAPNVPSGRQPAPPPAAPSPPGLGESTVMMATPPIPSPPGGGEATVAFSAPNFASYGAASSPASGLPGARGNPPAPARPSIDIPVVRAPAYGGGEEATRMIDIPVMAAAAPVPNNDSTRMIEGLNVASLLASVAAKGGQSGGGEHTITSEQSGTVDSKGNRRKPVADVKAKSKAKVTPIDPGRLLVQQEAAEQRKSEATMMGTLDSFLKQPSASKKVGLDEDLPTEGTMVGKFLGFFGSAGAAGPAATAAPVGKDPTDEAWEAVREAPLLNGLNPQFITDAIKAGDLKLVRSGRDLLLETQGRALLMVEGQASMARFNAEVLDRERRAQAAYKAGDKKAEKREMKRRQEVGPLIRMCETNLGLFTEGDLITLDNRAPDAANVAVYAITPVRLLSISMARLETWRRTYQFFGDRLRRATDAARSRLNANTGARSLVADFFVRHGLSVAMSLRVRELDKCIECYECEKACEARYGVKRLSLNGKVLGALDFVDCCHTCVDQRCIDPCAYDAIKFDDDKKEVVILEDACIGCSLCALACPYDAIEMHDLEEKPLLQIRLQKENKLAYGEGKARKAKLRRIASKCDHCVSYEDQACISACPTSALLEIPPEAAFTERTDSMADAAKKGFEHSLMFDVNEIFDPKKFYKGLSEEDDKAKKQEQRFRTGWLWLISLLGTIGCIAEIVLRKEWPELSLLFYYLTKYLPEDHPLHLDPETALANIDFRPGAPFALWLGYIGTVIMFSSMFYSVHKWVPKLKKLGGQQAMFDYHVWAGTMGPVLVGLHTAAKLDNWVSLAIYAMLATVISGVIGRYLSTELPDLASQASLLVMEYERKLADLRNRHAGVNVADRFYASLKKHFARVTDPKLSGIGAGWMALRMMIWDAIARPFQPSILRYRLSGIKDPKARTKVAFIATELALFERRRVLYPKIEPMFREWKIVHIPFAIALTLLSGIHIVIELLK